MDQNTNINENVDTLFHSLENFTQKEGILGKPVSQGAKTLIPVLSITVGYGTGNVTSKTQTSMASTSMPGGALGLGAKLSTDAVIVFDNNNDDVSMLPMSATSGNITQIIDKIPQMVSGMSTNKQSQ